jgi:hypothetical protein
VVIGEVVGADGLKDVYAGYGLALADIGWIRLGWRVNEKRALRDSENQAFHARSWVMC